MIIGTAGHIDRGKTSLVKALTGVDADRLKEEKQRGITIDLGFAYKPPPDGEELGFVDVPGHEKLVRNMLSGATGIDHVMLVIAEDDGPMLQTHEHLAILDLLGLAQGVVALSKCDLVTPERLAQARSEVRALLTHSVLADAPILALSSVTGEGIAELFAHLDQARASPMPRRQQGQFRLAVDRSFTLAGISTVVTGTAVAGRVAAGDRLKLSPRGLDVRVRGIHAQNRQAGEGGAGQQLALNLAGVDKADVRRGDWVLAEALHAPTQRFDARVRLLPGESRPLAHNTPLHLHLGAEDVSARVMMLEGAAIAPGRSALVQLSLDRPIGALHGDHFILRDQSALRTLGGGVVVDAFPPASRRRREQRLAALAAMERPAPAEALAAALALEPPFGIELRAFAVQWNLGDDGRRALLAAVPHRALSDAGQELLFAPVQIERYASRISEHLGAHRMHLAHALQALQNAQHRVLAQAAVAQQHLAEHGRVHAVGAEYFIQTQHMLGLALQAHTLAEADEHKRLNLKELREASGISRHLSVPLVEYFDQIGLTKSDAVGRHFRSDRPKVFQV